MTKIVRRKSTLALDEGEVSVLRDLYTEKGVSIDRYERMETVLRAFTTEWNARTERSDAPWDILHFMRNERKCSRWVRLPTWARKRTVRPRATARLFGVSQQWADSLPLPESVTFSPAEGRHLLQMYQERCVDERTSSDAILGDDALRDWFVVEAYRRMGRQLTIFELAAHYTSIRKRGALPCFRVPPTIQFPSSPRQRKAACAHEQLHLFEPECVTTCLLDERRPKDFFALGWDAEQRGDDAAALRAYHAHLEADGPSSVTSFNIANLHFRAARFEAAAERFRSAVELDQDFAEAWNNLGTALMRLDRHEDAVRAFERALRVRPGYGDVHFNLAQSLRVLGHLGEEQEHWRRYLAITPANEYTSIAEARLEESVNSASDAQSSAS